LFPLTAPLAMPNRIAMGVPTWFDPLLAALLTVATIAGFVVLGGRVYTRAILHTGSTLSLADAWRGAPHPDVSDATGPGGTPSLGKPSRPAGASRSPAGAVEEIDRQPASR
jgi:ABC-2 type transport system permease protein